MNWQAATGLSAGVLAFGATIPYIRATERREIRPSAVTWAGWWLFSAIVFVAQMLSEPSWSAAISGSAALYCAAVTVLAVRNSGLGVVALDVVCGLLGLAAIVAWQVTQDPRLALAIAIGGDAILCVPTIAKTIRDPGSELAWRFLVVTVASLLGVASAGTFDFLSLGWPVYLTVCNATVGLVALRSGSPAVADASV